MLWISDVYCDCLSENQLTKIEIVFHSNRTVTFNLNAYFRLKLNFKCFRKYQIHTRINQPINHICCLLSSRRLLRLWCISTSLLNILNSNRQMRFHWMRNYSANWFFYCFRSENVCVWNIERRRTFSPISQMYSHSCNERLNESV